MIFNRRDYQSEIILFIQLNLRCGVFAGMGVGKTVATLTALQELNMVEDVFPALVIAPLRVAWTTWPDESAKWDHLDLIVIPVIGNANARRAALLKKAEVYTTNYENLPWLREHFGNDWPFKTVVADESTRLKSFRLKQGTQRAKALGQVAHTHVTRFIALTGTPAPNGIIDVWGQTWFLDKGDRLGRTFTAFTERWFWAKRYGFEPMRHAQKEIQEMIRDVCITVTAADYMDLPDLIDNDVIVDLPPSARLLYSDMEQKMFAMIEEFGIEAPNTAAVINKCLQIAAGAAYVDDRGTWKHIHDAKLDALTEIIEASGGMPVLVSYMFKSDLARILKRFGSKARHLDRNPKTVIEWNAGKIPILCAHPASAGHGLNLQFGSNIIAYFSSGWNLEHDMQILERIGPTRQAQAGLNREVYVHRIVARNTVDEMVSERREGKKSVQEVLLAAMRRHGKN
jgi:SNF2 family DNA or RNA helicase